MTADPQQSLSQNVYQALKREILECDLPPNSDLREQVLAQRFVVSKSPVREALLRLEQERLITVTPRQGYRVASVSLEDAHESFELRKVLESACAEAAATKASAEELKSLDAFRSLDLFSGSDQTDTFIRYNRSFHSAMCTLSGNARLARITIDLIEHMERMIRFSVNAVPLESRDVLLREHCTVIDAIQARDRRAASRLIKMHISGVEKRVIGGLARVAMQVSDSAFVPSRAPRTAAPQ